MTTFHERYPGDTLEQYLMDTECSRYEADSRGMLEHLRMEHNVEKDYLAALEGLDLLAEPGWNAVAEAHVEAHRRELEGLDDPNGLGYRWTFHGQEESFASRMAISMLAGREKDAIWEQFQGVRSPSQLDVVMRVTLNGVEVDAAAIMESLERNFDWNVELKVAEKLKELRFDELAQTVSDMDYHLSQRCKLAMKAAGMEIPDEEEWR